MTTNKLQFIRVLGGLALILLAACDRIEPPVATEPTPITAPEGVLRSREAVLAFLRDGAAECVPAKQAKWTVEREAEAPQGFDVYRFLSSGCTMTITVPQSSEVTRYHVALGDGPTGFCWQAVVDAQGQVVLTGNEAQTDATLGNPALAYCEEHGYTYGAGSRFFMEPTTGCFMAYSAVKADVTGPALLEFYKELDRVRSGDISLEEVGKGARSLRTDLIDSLSGLGAVVGQAAYYDSLGLPFSTLAADLDDIARVSKDDLNRIAPRGVPLDKSILVLVGDRNVIDSALSEVAKSGRTLPKVEEVDAWGEPVQTPRAMSKSE